MLNAVGQNVILEIVERKAELENRLKKSGLLMPGEMAQGQPNRGHVYAIGDGIVDPEYKIGDLVMFNLNEMFQGFKYDDKNLVTVKHEEIVAIITEEA